MATNNLVIKSLGKIEYGSGNGNPDHVATKGSFYIDNDNDNLYVNTDGTSTGWTLIIKSQKAELYLQSNTTASPVTQNIWSPILGTGTVSTFNTSAFTYSRTLSLISATGDGGFANTTISGTGGFATNGWTLVNGALGSRWFVGTTGASGGSGFGAYISTNGSTNVYSNSPSGQVYAVYFYKDVQIPAFVTSLGLSFSLRVGGEGSTTPFDYLRVYNVATSQAFVAGTEVAGGEVSINSFLPTTVATSSYGTRNLSLTVPLSVATQSRRICFGWINDSSIDNQPGASVDNISLVANLPVSLTYTGSQSTFRTVLTGSFQATAAIANVGVQIAKNTLTASNISESTFNIGTNFKDSFTIQNTFTMSNGDVVRPLIINKSSATSITVNDLSLAIWEIE